MTTRRSILKAILGAFAAPVVSAAPQLGFAHLEGVFVQPMTATEVDERVAYYIAQANDAYLSALVTTAE